MTAIPADRQLGKLILRDYQQRALEALRSSYAAGHRAPCLVAPTGSGKTVLFATVAANAIPRGNRTLIVTDRVTLKDQTVAMLARAGVDDVRVIQADIDTGRQDAPVIVASAQTLRLPRWRDQLPDLDLIVWDECHGVATRTYDATLKRYPNARRLGLTATPCRADNRPLDAFDDLVVGPSMRELIALGHLAPPHVLRPPEGALQDGQIAIDPVAAYRRHAEGKRAAVFCLTVEQAQRYADDFRAAGITAEVVTAKTRDRAAVIARFAADQFRILISVGCLTQGWDDPGCGVAILARKPAHVGLWLQICGRVLRPFPGKTEGLIIDLCGALWLHGLPEIDREYSLSGKAISSVVKDSLSQCRACGSAFLSGPRACPYCNAELPHRPTALPRVAGVDLVGEPTPPRPKQEFIVAMTSTRHGWCERCRGPIRPQEEILWATVARTARHRNCQGGRISL